MADDEQAGLTALTVQLLSAYVASNQVPSEELPKLIANTREALAGKSEPVAPPPEEYVRAVTLKASTASPDHILSMIDGKPYKTLRRHLGAAGLTPAEYKARYKLPASYPMVAPAYSAARREAAKKIGLGNIRRGAEAPAPAEVAPEAAIQPARGKKGSGKPATRKAAVAGGKPAAKTATNGRTRSKASASSTGSKRKRTASGPKEAPAT